MYPGRLQRLEELCFFRGFVPRVEVSGRSLSSEGISACGNIFTGTVAFARYIGIPHLTAGGIIPTPI